MRTGGGGESVIGNTEGLLQEWEQEDLFGFGDKDREVDDESNGEIKHEASCNPGGKKENRWETAKTRNSKQTIHWRLLSSTD